MASTSPSLTNFGLASTYTTDARSPSTPVHDTMSLRPQGFYGKAFVVSRISCMLCLATIIGLIGNLLSVLKSAGQSPSASLVGTLVLVPSAPFPRLDTTGIYADVKVDNPSPPLVPHLLQRLLPALPPLPRHLADRPRVPHTIHCRRHRAEHPALVTYVRQRRPD